MKKFLKIFVVILFIIILFIGIMFYTGHLGDLIDLFFTPKTLVKVKDIDNINVDYFIGMSDEQKYSFDIKDKQLEEEIINSINGKVFSDYSANYGLIICRNYKVNVGDDINFEFDRPDASFVYLTYKGKKIMTKFDNEILKKIADFAQDEFVKTIDINDSFEAEQLEIYTYNEKYCAMRTITEQDRIDNFLEFCKNSELEQTEANDPLIEKAKYKIFLNKDTWICINEDFSQAILSVPPASFSLDRSYHKISQAEQLKNFVDEVNTNEKYQILEFYAENYVADEEIYAVDGRTGVTTVHNVSRPRLEVAVKDETLSNRGVELIARFNTNVSYERGRTNDFMLYKDNDGEWEELEALVELDLDIISKNADRFNENIDWTEMYGELPQGKYKFTRNVFVDRIEYTYFMIFEIK